MSPARICILPRLSGVGGMVSFRARLSSALIRRGIQVSADLGDEPYRSILVIGGTRQLWGLWRARRQGVRIVQRLDGMNWMHRLRPVGARRLGARRLGARHFLRAEYGNLLLSFIRDHLADRVVYQSEFARRWWERQYGPARALATVVHNGVDLQEYSPEGPQNRPADCYRLLLVEGSLMGGYEIGLQVAVSLVEDLNHTHGHQLNKPVELMVVGRVAPEVQAHWEARARVRIHWVGLLPGGRIPEVDRSAHLLYSADVNAACPNSVIEALACGLPVLAYATGALPELVMGQAGRIVSYGGDPWRLDPPDIGALSQAAVEILTDQEPFRQAARQRAEAAFDLERTVAGYLGVLLDS